MPTSKPTAKARLSATEGLHWLREQLKKKDAEIDLEGLKFQTGHVEADFDGVTYEFEFQYRDPWKWIVDLLSDPTLASNTHWHPVRKFLFKDRVKVQLFDEPYTANKWWNIQNNLPHIPGLPHCFIPIALWLDKGMVTKRAFQAFSSNSWQTKISSLYQNLT
ncbi:hypothetical protein B0H13DRAFT_1857073 [Mycena leptocephala]|nr:hypothetical protein B0H13DRAFT_1857073 [Mycena leptocephala]